MFPGKVKRRDFSNTSVRDDFLQEFWLRLIWPVTSMAEI